MSSLIKNSSTIITLSLLTILLANCGGSSSTSSTSSNGAITLHIADAPVDDAEAVWIQFRGLEIHGGNGANYTFYYCADAVTGITSVSTSVCQTAAPKKLNLLALTNGVTDLLLDRQSLSSGQYEWIRLMVDAEDNVRDSYIVIGGAEYELKIPSGAQSGLKLNRGFTVAANGEAQFTIDFDLRKSIHASGSGNEYKLRPTLRIVDNSNLSNITGTAPAALLATACNGAVYVYAGSNVTPDDLGSGTAEPLTVAKIDFNSTNGNYEYRASFLEAANYTIAITCDADKDNPEINDNLNFIATTTVAVTASQNTTFNF